MCTVPMLRANGAMTGFASAESAVAQWRQWRVDLPGKPEIVRALGQGLSNQSYLLQAGETFMALRINNDNVGQQRGLASLPGIDRQREAAIWHAASMTGIAPALLFANERYLVSSFVATKDDLARIDLARDDLADQVFSLIEKCHTIEITTHRLDYAQHIQTYWSKVEQSGFEQSGKSIDPTLLKQRQPMQESLQVLLDQQQSPVLCHHDPVMANFVGTSKCLYLIDWEYAAKGMAVMDYAALAVEWGFSDANICARTQIRLDSLVMAKKLYRYMCQLWKAAQSEP